MKIEIKSEDLIVKDIKCFDLKTTVLCGQAFRWSETADGIMQAVVKGEILSVQQTKNELIFKNTSKEKFESEWCEYFDLNTNYHEICQTLKSDVHLKNATEEFYGIRILKQDKWETLCSFIISQNNNIPRIMKIINSLCENFGEKIADGAYSFPTAEKIASLTLDEIGIIKSGFRGKYILDAAQKIASGEIDLNEIENMNLQETEQTLMKIKGVGPKVAACVALFGFYKVDAFPIDVWVKKIMSELYPDGLPACTKGIEGIAQQYLFHWRRNSVCFDVGE